MVTPESAPPYLQGQLSDMHDEPGGGVNFIHPAGNLGQPDQESARVHLSPEQTRATFDVGYRSSDPEQAVNDEYMPPRPVMFGERMQRGVGGWLKNHLGGGSDSTLKNIAGTGLLGAIAGGAGGAYLAAKNDQPMLDKAVLYALLGGAGAAGISAYLNHQNAKTVAGMRKQASVMQALNLDSSMNDQQKMMLLEAISKLPQRQHDELEHLVGSAGGAAVGLLIAKYLGMRGVLSPLAMALIGGSIGQSMTGKQPRYNAFGQPDYEY